MNSVVKIAAGGAAGLAVIGCGLNADHFLQTRGLDDIEVLEGNRQMALAHMEDLSAAKAEPRARIIEELGQPCGEAIVNLALSDESDFVELGPDGTQLLAPDCSQVEITRGALFDAQTIQSITTGERTTVEDIAEISTKITAVTEHPMTSEFWEDHRISPIIGLLLGAAIVALKVLKKK